VTVSGLSPDNAPSVFSPSDLAELPGALRAVRVGGRVVHVEPTALTIADAFAALPVELVAPHPAKVGDLVVVAGAPRPGRLARASIVEHAPAMVPDLAATARETETGRLLERGVGRALAARAALLRAIRGMFDARHFLEVDTPSLVPSPGLDVHLDAFEVPGHGYLITSPEYQMKRLLAGGIPRCFQLARCFRAGEEGGRHNREFLMLEWYRTFAGMEEVLRDTEDLVRLAAQEISGGTELDVDGVTVDVGAPFERLRVAAAFERYAGVDEERALAMAKDDEEQFFRLLVERVEPAIARSPRPVFLIAYPASQASLARVDPADPRVCERFELYVGGVELCNGFGELTDPAEQRRRFERDQAERARTGKPVYPIDERFLAALREGMPRAAGNALGVDRLLALCLGERSIGDVMGFPRAWL
jgi:elongation factor P--(R)-beta-lysine ligase